MSLQTPPWQEAAACRGADTELFFPGKGDSVAPALAYCRSCDVVAVCLAASIAEPDGIWGGTTGRQRRDLRRLHPAGPVAHGTRAKYVTGCRCPGCSTANSIYQRRRRHATTTDRRAS